MKLCRKCGASLESFAGFLFRDICPKCGADLHSCLNCRFYDTSKSNQCFANVEEPVIYKDRANFCEEFSFGSAAEQAREAGNPSAKDVFNRLFKK